MKMNKLSLYFVGCAMALSSCSDDITAPESWPEWPGRVEVSVNDKSLSDTYYGPFQGTKLNLTEGQTVSFSGFEHLRYALQGHFWTVTSDAEAVFKGATGEYDFIYDSANGVAYVEQPAKEHPDALYIIGAQFGHPGAISPITTAWSIDAPDNAQTLRKIGDNKFEIELLLGSGFQFKFFTHRGWGLHEDGIEIWSTDVMIQQPTLVSTASSGDFIAGPMFTPGVYTLTVDLKAGTFSLDSDTPIEVEDFYVNGEAMQPVGAYLCSHLHINKGDDVVFGNFGGISEVLQADFFDIKSDVEGRATFTGESGEYDIYYDASHGAVYVANPSASFPDALWITGSGYGHPSGVPANSWQMAAPNAIMCKKVAENIFESTVYLSDNFDIKTFKALDWGAEAGSNVFTPFPQSAIDKLFYATEEGNAHTTGDFKPGPGFVPGKYTLRFNAAKGTCVIKELADEDKIDGNYSVNGLQMQHQEIGGRPYLTAELNLTKGQKVDFGGFRYLEYLLQPEYFAKSGDGWAFCAADGKYRISYSTSQERIYVQRVDKTTFAEGVLFITGQKFGHPASTWLDVDMASWGFEPHNCVCCVSPSPGVYETNLNLRPGFVLCCYPTNNWGDVVIKPNEYTIIGDNITGFSSNEASFLGPDNWDFNPGTFNVVINTNNKTVSFSRIVISNKF